MFPKSCSASRVLVFLLEPSGFRGCGNHSLCAEERGTRFPHPETSPSSPERDGGSAWEGGAVAPPPLDWSLRETLNPRPGAPGGSKPHSCRRLWGGTRGSRRGRRSPVRSARRPPTPTPPGPPAPRAHPPPPRPAAPPSFPAGWRGRHRTLQQEEPGAARQNHRASWWRVGCAVPEAAVTVTAAAAAAPGTHPPPSASASRRLRASELPEPRARQSPAHNSCGRGSDLQSQPWGSRRRRGTTGSAS